MRLISTVLFVMLLLDGGRSFAGEPTLKAAIEKLKRRDSAVQPAAMRQQELIPPAPDEPLKPRVHGGPRTAATR